MTISNEAVEAAARAIHEAGDWDEPWTGDDWRADCARSEALRALEAVAPIIRAGALEAAADSVSQRIDQIEAHQVPECEYGALLAQREEAASIYRDLRARAAAERGGR